MAIKIDYTQKVTVSGELKFSSAQSLEVEAYDQIESLIPKKEGLATIKTIDVQPMGNSDDIEFLLITSDRCADTLKYKVGDGPEIVLNAPHLFAKNTINLLDDNKAPQQINFTNDDDQNDVRVSIIVGRKAVAS